MTDAERIEELLGEKRDLLEDLDQQRANGSKYFASWREEYWKRLRAEQNLANALLSVNGVVGGDWECHHENLGFRDDGLAYCQNTDCEAQVNADALPVWKQESEREWTLYTYGDVSQFRVWEIRGGRFVIMAHQPGRIKRGENPTYVKLWGPPFIELPEAQSYAERLQAVLDTGNFKPPQPRSYQ